MKPYTCCLSKWNWWDKNVVPKSHPVLAARTFSVWSIRMNFPGAWKLLWISSELSSGLAPREVTINKLGKTITNHWPLCQSIVLVWLKRVSTLPVAQREFITSYKCTFQGLVQLQVWLDQGLKWCQWVLISLPLSCNLLHLIVTFFFFYKFFYHGQRQQMFSVLTSFQF